MANQSKDDKIIQTLFKIYEKIIKEKRSNGRLMYDKIWANAKGLLFYASKEELSEKGKTEFSFQLLKRAKELTTEVPITNFELYCPTVQYFWDNYKNENGFKTQIVKSIVTDMQSIAYQNKEISNEERKRIFETGVKLLSSLKDFDPEQQQQTIEQLREQYEATLPKEFRRELRETIDIPSYLKRPQIGHPKTTYMNRDTTSRVQIPFDFEAMKPVKSSKKEGSQFYVTDKLPFHIKGRTIYHGYFILQGTGDRLNSKEIRDVYFIDDTPNNLTMRELKKQVMEQRGMVLPKGISQIAAERFIETLIAKADSEMCHINDGKPNNHQQTNDRIRQIGTFVTADRSCYIYSANNRKPFYGELPLGNRKLMQSSYGWIEEAVERGNGYIGHLTDGNIQIKDKRLGFILTGREIPEK